MVFKSGSNKQQNENIRPLRINNNDIDFVNSFRYLGYIVSSSMDCNEDITRARNKFYAQFNMLLRKFHFSDINIQLFLFRQFCLQVYGCELWFGGSYSITLMKDFGIGYHKAVKKILKLSYHESNHYACQEAQVFTFSHFINKCKITAALRVLNNPCNFIRKILDFFMVSSIFLQDVYSVLRDFYDIDSLLFNDKQAIISRISYVQNHESQMRDAVLLHVCS